MLRFGERGLPRSECLQLTQLALGWPGGAREAAEGILVGSIWGDFWRAGDMGAFQWMSQFKSQ